MATKTDPTTDRPRRLGCGLAALAALGALIGVGWWLGHREQARKSPCERYVEVMRTALDNCHSGATQNHDHHMAICETQIDPSDACLERIEALSRQSCETLERGPAGFGPACEKPR